MNFFSTCKNRVLSLMLLAGTCIMPLHSAEAPLDKVNEWINTFPYIGLVAKEVTYGPITLKDFDMEHEGRVVIVVPEEVINCSVKYKINSDKIESWNVHHVIVGIKGQDSQECITHSIGKWDKKGQANFTLNAPTEKGVYEVRFDYQTGLTCQNAIELWKLDSPSSKATVGIIIVE